MAGFTGLSLVILLDVGLTGWTWSTGYVGMRVSAHNLGLQDEVLTSTGLWNMQLGIKPSKQSKHSAIRASWADLSTFER